jgi:hypothetical protein
MLLEPQTPPSGQTPQLNVALHPFDIEPHSALNC